MAIIPGSTVTNQTCINECTKCAQACLECFTLCLNEPDVQDRKNCISMLMECACICKEAAAFMSMNAQHSKDLCTLCAAICKKCAQECGMFQDEHCKECANICNTCATECENMIG